MFAFSCNFYSKLDYWSKCELSSAEKFRCIRVCQAALFGYTLFLYSMRKLFFRLRLNILIFLPVLG